MMKINLTRTFEIPSLAKSNEEAQQLLSLGNGVKDQMLLTLVIPFAFMLFMSVSMDRVWSLYLMLQVSSNLMNINIKRPGNAEYIMFIGKNISFFKVMEE